MAIDVSQVGGQMLSAALPILAKGGSSVKDYAEDQFKQIAQRIADIGEQRIEGNLSDSDAKALLDMQIKSTENVFLTVEGLTEIIIEQAINAALNVVKEVVNTGVGFGLI
jgi:hypothetical protein